MEDAETLESVESLRSVSVTLDGYDLYHISSTFSAIEVALAKAIDALMETRTGNHQASTTASSEAVKWLETALERNKRLTKAFASKVEKANGGP